MKNVYLILSIFLCLNACSTSPAPKQINPTLASDRVATQLGTFCREGMKHSGSGCSISFVKQTPSLNCGAEYDVLIEKDGTHFCGGCGVANKESRSCRIAVVKKGVEKSSLN
jgi:hypothetical protein